MPILVNGQIVSEAQIREEMGRLSANPAWKQIPDEGERERNLRSAAEAVATDRILITQLAELDPRAVDDAELDRYLQTAHGAPARVPDGPRRDAARRAFKYQRFVEELVADAASPEPDQVEAFYSANKENFRLPELFHAAHIIKHVRTPEDEEPARQAIYEALEALESGEPFPQAARRFSDCPEGDGDIGEFPAGEMVAEFEEKVFQLEPGQRTGVFRSPLGFHIAMLISRRSPGAADFEMVRGDIERVFAMSRKNARYREKMAELKTAADIQVVSG